MQDYITGIRTDSFERSVAAVINLEETSFYMRGSPYIVPPILCSCSLYSSVAPYIMLSLPSSCCCSLYHAVAQSYEPGWLMQTPFRHHDDSLTSRSNPHALDLFKHVIWYCCIIVKLQIWVHSSIIIIFPPKCIQGDTFLGASLGCDR